MDELKAEFARKRKEAEELRVRSFGVHTLGLPLLYRSHPISIAVPPACPKAGKGRKYLRRYVRSAALPAAVSRGLRRFTGSPDRFDSGEIRDSALQSESRPKDGEERAVSRATSPSCVLEADPPCS